MKYIRAELGARAAWPRCRCAGANEGKDCVDFPGTPPLDLGQARCLESGEVELWTPSLGKWFSRAEMMARAPEIWPIHVIEEVLGEDADVILPQVIRSAELLRVRLPRHHIDMLHYRQTSIEELSAALPGFAGAMARPAG